MHLAILALLCSSFCAAQSSIPQTKFALPDDKTNWGEVWKVLNSTGLSRTDDPNLPVFDTIFRVNAKERGQGTGRSDNIFLFQADIQMDKSEVAQIISQGSQGSQGTSRGKRAVMKKTKSNLWKRNIAYVLDSRLSARARAVIKSAIREWHQTLPCMGSWNDVTRRRRRPRDHMYFFPGGGCYSQVGRRGGRQKVSIGRGCEYHGIAVHEIGHAMGLWHEQSRPDRDYYVRIKWNNIIPAMKFNFQKYTSARINSLRVPYDYGSVMHYGATAFARGRGLRTIENIRGRQRLGQRRGLSTLDKKQVRLLYGCTKRPSGCLDKPQTSGKCGRWKNEGYCKQRSRYFTYMQSNCCKTCKKFTVPKICVNKSNNCPSWSRSGYCTRGQHIQYMKNNCAKSCGCI